MKNKQTTKTQKEEKKYTDWQLFVACVCSGVLSAVLTVLVVVYAK